jgi:hypothetical protein
VARMPCSFSETSIGGNSTAKKWSADFSPQFLQAD